MDAAKFKAPKTLLKILLSYYRRHQDDLELLFQLTECLAPSKLVTLRPSFVPETADRPCSRWRTSLSSGRSSPPKWWSGRVLSGSGPPFSTSWKPTSRRTFPSPHHSRPWHHLA